MNGQFVKACSTDTLAVITGVVTPSLRKGVLRRRSKVVALPERFLWSNNGSNSNQEHAEARCSKSSANFPGSRRLRIMFR